MECHISGDHHLFNADDSHFIDIIQSLDEFAAWYSSVHKVMGVFICVFGVMANFVHTVILTRPVMKRSTVNRLLAFMACCDIVKMLSYLIYLIRFSIYAEPPRETPEGLQRRGFPFRWIVFLLAHVTLSIGLHATSLYLSVCTAFIRYKAIHQLSSRFMQPEIAWKLFVCVLCFVGILCIPTFAVHRVFQDSQKEYTIGLQQQTAFACFLFQFNLWLTGIFFKGVPCMLLIFFTFLLLYKLHMNRRTHEKIVSKDAASARGARSDRTTLLLILLLFVFIITELPQGVLAVLNGFFPDEVHMYIYTPLGEVLDLLSLINSNACFILYPCISSQYRESFRMLIARLRQRWQKKYQSVATKDNPRMTSENSKKELYGQDRSPSRHTRTDDPNFLGPPSPSHFYPLLPPPPVEEPVFV